MTSKQISIWLGPALFFLLMLVQPDGISDEGWSVVRVAAWMLVWWVSEAVPIAVTSLLPIVLFPILGLLSIDKACMPYGHKFVFLFLGGFILALAMEKCALHKRIALGIVSATGSGANTIILGFMLATAALSMWISNTATTLMMLPIATSIIALLAKDPNESRQTRNFSLAILLGIAYAANVGGIATLVGTPPNLVMAGILSDNYEIEVTFTKWLAIGLPFSLIMLAIVYVMLTQVIYQNRIGRFGDAREIIQAEVAKLGRWTGQQQVVFGVFLITALLWIFRGQLNSIEWIPVLANLNDTTIAIVGAILLFILPARQDGKWEKRILSWADTSKLPWGILLLFGGGMSLAAGFKASGLIESIAGGFADFSTLGVAALIMILALISLFLTEMMSNLALVNIFVPVVAAISFGGGESPLMFAVPVTMAASCAFMFPMSTPPNAIVFASGQIKISQMARAGILLNLLAVVVITVFCYFVLERWIGG